MEPKSKLSYYSKKTLLSTIYTQYSDLIQVASQQPSSRAWGAAGISKIHKDAYVVFVCILQHCNQRIGVTYHFGGSPKQGLKHRGVYIFVVTWGS